MNRFEKDESDTSDKTVSFSIAAAKYETSKFLCERFNYLADRILTFDRYEQFADNANALEELELDMKEEGLF